jgi:tetratricopeptide (TPR) repeat protein
MTEEQIKLIKIDANKAFEKNEYNQGFSILEKLDVLEFITFSEKKGWVSKGNASRFFWNEWLLKNLNYFSQLMDSKLAVPFLHNYFSKSRVFSKPFEKKISTTHPELFVEAIRKSQVFFKENRIAFLLDEIELPSALEIHQDVWEHINLIELDLWSKIEKEFNSIINYDLDDILYTLVKVIEIKKHEEGTRIDIQFLGDSYSFFMEMILSSEKMKYSNTSTENFEVGFIKSLFDKSTKKLEELISNCISLIKKRLHTFSNIFDNYSFNQHITPKHIYESIFFIESPESYYQWKHDGIRYQLAELLYRLEGEVRVDNALLNTPDFKIQSAKKEDYNDNKELASILTGIMDILGDLKLEKYYYKNKTIEAVKIIKPMFTIAYNRHVRYSNQLEDIKFRYNKSTSTWIQNYTLLIEENGKSIQVPFVYFSINEYKELNAKNDTNGETTDVIIHLFGHKQQTNKLSFDRFNIRYSVFKNPYLILGNYLFSPISFLTSYISTFTYIDSLLSNDKGRTGNLIENSLSEYLKAHNFNVLLADEQEQIMEGDADLIVYDEGYALLIQLKRTNLRINTSAQYDELLKVDTKAADQLNKAETFLKTNNNIFNIGRRKVFKWIVSNSFENINTFIDGCLKVNYIELMLFLKNREGMSFDSLSSFISFNEKDTFFKEIVKYTNAFDESFKLDEISNYVFPFSDYDSLKASKYEHFFNKGLQLNAQKKYKESIKEFKKCIKCGTNDVRIHSAIANVYADLKDYKNAFKHYEQALILLPNDPFITRNLAITKRESGDLDFLDTYEMFKSNFPLIKA